MATGGPVSQSIGSGTRPAFCVFRVFAVDRTFLEEHGWDNILPSRYRRRISVDPFTLSSERPWPPLEHGSQPNATRMAIGVTYHSNLCNMIGVVGNLVVLQQVLLDDREIAWFLFTSNRYLRRDTAQGHANVRKEVVQYTCW